MPLIVIMDTCRVDFTKNLACNNITTVIDRYHRYMFELIMEE